MKRRIILGLVLLAIAFLAVNVRVGYAGLSAAPRTTGYTVDWYTVDDGGAQNLIGGSYSLSGTVGQPDVGVLSGGDYMLNGGFWGGATTNYSIYLPLVIKQS